MNKSYLKSNPTTYATVKSLIFIFLFFIQGGHFIHGQIVNLPCQTEAVAVEDLERKDFEFPSGSTAIHSEGSMHNFTLPLAADYGPCKIISNINVVISAFGVDLSNLPPDCAPTPVPYYYNIALGCPSFAPASCPTSNLLGEPNTPTFTNQNFSYNGNFDFGENLSVDIVPVMNINCTNGQSALTSNSVVLDYEICVTVTITDATSTIDVELGPDINVCPNETTTIDAGFIVDADYLWDPNGETTQMITAGEGTYTITVTDMNGCTDSDVINVLEFTESNITFDPAAPNVCDNGQVSVSVNETFNSYNWSNSASGQTVSLTTGTYDVTITDSNNCTAVNSITITNIDPPNAGSDNSIDVCNDGTTYDIDALLMAHDPGGNWTDNDASGVDVNANPQSVDFDNIMPGTYTYTYTATGAVPCPDDQATITVDVFEQNNAGTSASVQYCADPGFLDFNLLIGNPDAGGNWSDINGSGVDVNSNPSAVDMDGVPPGVYVYEYELPSNGPCPTQAESLTVTIIESADAGFNNSITVCEGTQFDLTNLINGANGTGVFEDTGGSGALSGSIVNTTGLAGQSFIFTFIVGSMSSPCGEDQAVYTVNVETILFAGNDVSDSYCIGANLNLSDILQNEDPGGTFSDISGSGGLVNDILITSGISPGTYVYEYVIGDGLTCPQDVSEIILTFFDDPNYNFIDAEITICVDNCETIEVLLSGTPPFDFPIEVYSEASGQLIASSNIFTTNNSYTFTTCNSIEGNTFENDTLSLVTDSTWYVTIPSLTDANNCVINNTQNPDTIFINTVTTSFYNLDTFACITDTVIIEGVQLFDGNSTFVDTLAGMFCDSIVNINVTFLDIDTIQLTPIICSGDSVLIQGFWFDESFNSAEISIVNPNGCDSLIIIDLSIYPPADSLIDFSLCSGDSLTINGTVYNDMNPIGTEILTGQSENGCDSIINISLSFTNDILVFITDTLCPGQSIQVAGSTYDAGNPSGQVIISGSGCDSIINIDLSFYQPAENSISGIFCPEFSTTVNGAVYDINNTSGTEVISNGSQFGCDSTVTIDLQFHPPATNNIMTTICEDESINVNGTDYNISNPSGTEVIIDGSQFGCDSTITINLQFHPPAITDFMLTICENESLNVNGTEYNISNPSGTEVIMGSSQFGCDSTVNIDLSFLPTYNINTSSMLCEGDSIFLAGAWQFDAGSYVDNFMTAEMCDSVVTTVVTLMSCEFIVNSSTTDNPCADGASGSFTLEIGSTFTPPIQIEWTGTTGTSGSTSITTENSVTIDNLVSDDYTVRILDSNNDVLWEETVSIIDLNPAINGAWSVVDSILCVGEEGTIEFTATGGQSPYNYDWSPSSIGNSSIASNVNAGDYFLTITDDNGCTLETSFTLIDPVGFTASTSTIDLSCLDSNDGQISIVNITGGQAPYIININNQPADSTTITGLSAGQYTIEVIDANNCRIGFTEELVAGNNPDFAVYTEDYTIEQGASVIIEGTIESGNFTFEWTDNDGTLNCTDCAFPTANPIVTTSYDLIITDESGCTQSLSVTVNVEIVEVVDAVPNVFSPNGDNNNDDFKFTSTNLLTIGIELRIYDRWGNKVHNAQIIGNEVIWDGTKAGRELDSGVYIYQMILQNSDGTSEVKFGDVLLLR